MEIQFKDFNFHPSVAEGLDVMGYTKPTPIQQQSIPIIMEGHDIVGCAQTGTGKTAAFLLPILSKLASDPKPNSSTRVLIIAPTRELVMQIDQQIEGFSYYTNVSSRAVYGGNDGGQWGLQRQALDQGADILVATPGRLIQFLQLGIGVLSGVETLILDEADRMLDMGFMPDIKRIVSKLPSERQTLLFSATMPREVRKLADTILHEPQSINIAVSKPAEKIKQYVLRVDSTAKYTVLKNFLSLRTELQSVIIFAERKVEVRELARTLHRAQFDVVEIHADLDQKEREDALGRFRTHQARILVATDILARGIDIDDIQMVINFSVPNSPESYVHRVGRTARADSDGEALTLCSPPEDYLLRDIEKLLEKQIDSLPEIEGFVVPTPTESAERKPRGGRPSQGARGGQKGAKPRSGTGQAGGKGRPSGEGKPQEHAPGEGQGAKKKRKPRRKPQPKEGQGSGQGTQPQKVDGAQPAGVPGPKGEGAPERRPRRKPNRRPRGNQGEGRAEGQRAEQKSGERQGSPRRGDGRPRSAQAPAGQNPADAPRPQVESAEKPVKRSFLRRLFGGDK
ncbi:MAG: hypothetical protein CSA07_03220 [Bacteroidia bacterium]|nr:MAG: hypothetical protein CSA07_03220 [Bacteroidia bacterium]